MKQITKTAYPDTSLRFNWESDNYLHLYIPNEFADLYDIKIVDGYLEINRIN